MSAARNVDQMPQQPFDLGGWSAPKRVSSSAANSSSTPRSVALKSAPQSAYSQTIQPLFE
jgi:hypothetical protein